MNDAQKQFLTDFIENADFENLTQGITVSRMNVHTEPMNWSGGVAVRQMTTRSEVSVDINHGLMRYGFVYALSTNIDYGAIEFCNSFTLGDLNPKIVLDNEVLDSYSAYLMSDDPDTALLIKNLFGRGVDNNTVHNPETNKTLEYLLRKEVVAKLNQTIEDCIDSEDFDTRFMRTMSETAKNGLEVSMSAMQTMIDFWGNTSPNNVTKQT